jgi:hypothetical protein
MWVTISLTELYEAKVGALVDACDQAALAAGQAGRAAGIIQGVVNEVRNAVASASENQVDADVTKVPEGLRDLSVDLIIARLKNTLEIPLTADETSNVTWRRQQLKAIAAGDLVVDQPDVPVEPEVQGGSGAELIREGAVNPFSGMGTT